MQNDHVTKPAEFTEETDAAKLPPAGKHWDAFMNHHWLPSLATKYGAELCDERTAKKRGNGREFLFDWKQNEAVVVSLDSR